MSSATSINGSDAERLPKATTQNTPTPGSRDSLEPWHFFVLLSLIAATAAVVLAREARPAHLILISLTIGAAGFAAAALYRTLAPLVGKDDALPASGLSESMRAVLEREKMLVLRSIKDLEFDRAMGKVSTKDFEEMAGRLRSRAMSLMRQLDTGAGYRELIERELQARLSNPALRTKRTGRPGSKDPGPTRDDLGPTRNDPGPTNNELGPTRNDPGTVDVAPNQASFVVPGSSAVAEAMADAVALAEASDPGSCVCGTVNDVDAAFCKRCGAKLATGTGA